MPIYIKTWGGKDLTLKVDPSDTIDTIKCKIQGCVGIPMDQQVLVFGGKLLHEDDKTLSDYNITRESGLQLTGRLAAGGKRARSSVMTVDKDQILQEIKDEAGLYVM